jgi:hypothetical protein
MTLFTYLEAFAETEGSIHSSPIVLLCDDVIRSFGSLGRRLVTCSWRATP